MPPSLRFTLDGESVEAQPDDTVAAALLRARITTFTRSIKYHRPRGPFCLQGSCGQCLLRVDGVPSVPACKVLVAEGMACVRQNAPFGLVEADLFRAADFLFPDHLDHHHLMVRSRLLGKVALEVARRLAGLGELPDRSLPPQPGDVRKVELLVVGAGPAGLAAAEQAAAAGAEVLLIEGEPVAGGAARFGLSDADPVLVAKLLKAAPCEPGAECVGIYPDDSAVPGNALVAVRRGDRLTAVVAERVIVAAGGVSQPLPFPGVDRPGVYAARGLIQLHAEHGVRVGKRLVVAGSGRELTRCSAVLRAAGYEVLATDKPIARALGKPVAAVEIGAERIRCDAVALAHEPAPFHELATGAGATARFDGERNGFVVEADAGGRTAQPWLYVAGRVAGRPALESGGAAGRAATA